MAEAALFSVASKLLSTIASPAFEKAYERVQSIRGASDELEELRESITSIQAVLLDAERKHNDSAAVKNWIRRVRDVMYDAEDLFDVVATDDLLKQRMKGKKHFKSVRVFFSKLNPIVSKDFISEKVKAIRKDLRRISDDMAMLGFVRCESENLSISGVKRGVETGSFVDSEDIIGRDDEKKRVIDFVFNEAYVDRTVSLFSVVGIGGMGKSALAQLVYNDTRIKDSFEYRYWACISNIFDEKEVLRKINQSMTDQQIYQELSLDQLQSSVRESINGKGKFLLVLDDLWDEDTGRWSKLLSILSSNNAKGSKIIITTRSLSVADAMRADEVLDLKGLSWDKSWELFRRYAFSKGRENDSTWISIGEKIARKCSNVPLAIKSIAGLLRIKDTIGEWRSLENEQLSKIQLSDNPIMATLRLSYDHLPSYLKNCFAFCSLAPRGCLLKKIDFVYLWIAQGYIMPKEGETLEMTGNACFMELFRRSFFQEAKYNREMEIKKCRIHDLVHDLAEDVAGDETHIITTQGQNQFHNRIRHLCVDPDENFVRIDYNLLLLDEDRLRTYFYNPYSCSPQLLDEQFRKLRFLRTLALGCRGIKELPSFIGEMKYLRYLDISGNQSAYLPDSITKLVNLITLIIGNCDELVELPRDIGELISLRHLINSKCYMLSCFPPTLGKLKSLQHLSEFRVTTNDDVHGREFLGLDALGRLNLQGSLLIEFDPNVEWSGDEVLLECGHVPDSLESLKVEKYPSTRMGAWWRDINPASSMLPKLECLYISCSRHVKYLPPLRCLPCLRSLHLFRLPSLEFIEDDDVVPSTTPFFPFLCTLEIVIMENLKGWSRPTNAVLSAAPNALIFPCLSKLEIKDCPNITSMPISAPCLKSVALWCIKGGVIEQLVSGPSASSVEKIEMLPSDDLTTFSGEGLTSLRTLKIIFCKNLSKVRVAPDTVEEFEIRRCPLMELWEEREDDEMSVDWTSFSNLRLLTLEAGEEGRTRLPYCLQQLVSLGKLHVKY